MRFPLYFFVSVCYTIPMRYDYQTLYHKNKKFLEEKPRLITAVTLYNRLIPYLFVAAYLFLWAYGMFWGEFSPRDYMRIFLIPVLALLLVSVLRMAIDRPRPFSEEGANVTPLKEKKGGRNSFPSRHLTCAAVISMTFLPYLSAVSALLFLLSMGLGYTRFALGWHYPSDLVAGLALGTAVGLCIFFL